MSAIEELGFTNMVNRVCLGTDANKPKSDPYVYINLMEYFGVLPRNCLLVEYSDVGIMAANNSGGNVVVYQSTANSEFSHIDHLMELCNVLSSF